MSFISSGADLTPEIVSIPNQHDIQFITTNVNMRGEADIKINIVFCATEKIYYHARTSWQNARGRQITPFNRKHSLSSNILSRSN